MAIELDVYIRAQFRDGQRTIIDRAARAVNSPSAANLIHNTQPIGTGAYEALQTPDVSASGNNVRCLIMNRDASNFVQLKLAASSDVTIKIQPGEFFYGEVETDDIQAQADTSAVDVEYLMVEV